MKSLLPKLMKTTFKKKQKSNRLKREKFLRMKILL